MLLKGEAELGLGRPYHAIRQLTWAVANLETQLGQDHPDSLVALRLLGCAYMETGVLEAAVPLLERAFHRQRRLLGSTSVETLTTMATLGRAYLECGRLPMAEGYLELCLDLAMKHFPNAAFTSLVRSLLGACWLAQNRVKEGESLLRSAYLDFHRKHSRSSIRLLHPLLVGTIQRISALLESADCKSLALRWKSLT